MLGTVTFYSFVAETVTFWFVYKYFETASKRGPYGRLQEQKEVLRKMIRQVADLCGVEVLTYCIMSNHFHVLLRVPSDVSISDVELKRRYKVLYPEPTKYQEATAEEMFNALQSGGENAEAIRRKLLTRMGDVSEFMKAVKQRFSVRYFTDGAILGSAEFVRGFSGVWQAERKRKYPPKVNLLKGADWGDLAVIQGLRKQVFN